MASYQRQTNRFFFGGLSLNAPPDALAPGKFPYVENVRSYVEGTLQPRLGQTQLNGAGLSGVTHSLFRLNDPTPTAAMSGMRVAGSGADLYTNDPSGNTFNVADTGYSGDPLNACPATPPQAIQPWLYVADSARMRKLNVNGDVFRTGILPPSAPTTEPIAALGQPGLNTISDMNSTAGWTTVVSGGTSSALSLQTRVNTNLNWVVYDSGTTGYGSFSCDMTNITTGTLLTIGGSETVLVTDILVAIANTTIASILYDSGATGLCTIQPAASLGVGQLEGPPYTPYRNRSNPNSAVPRGSVAGAGFFDTNFPDEPSGHPAKRIRQVDFPVNCIVIVGGFEAVRIISVALGPDGIQSFRCRTGGSYAAGATLSGVTGFRAYTVGAHGTGDAVTTSNLRTTLTPTVPTGTVSATVVGGIRSTMSVNLALINGRATLPDDDVHVAVKIDKLSKVQTIRLYLDVDRATPSANDFLQNYYFYEWRANDIISAIQSTNAAAIASLTDARQTTVTNAELSQTVDATSQNSAVPRIGTTVPTQTTGVTRPHTDTASLPLDQQAIRRNPASAVSADAQSEQLALGNNQWIDLRCKVRDLVRVGTDTGRTLQNVGAVEILVNAFTETANPVQIDYDALWFQGGFGMDVAEVGNPYVWAYRYRSTITGVVSNPSPPLRGGVVPRRQRVTLTGSQSADPQVDKLDWFRFGGTLTDWTYVQSSENSATPTLQDDLSDSGIQAGEIMREDNFPAWPTTDLPRTMTVSVAGTAVARSAGDSFNTSWAKGSVIVINGRVCTLYASPTNANLLHVNENVGSGTGLAAYVQQATLLGTPLPAIWGDFYNTFLACGDPNSPGTLYWSNPGSPESASDKNTVVVTSGAEPLQNGFMWDRVPYVASTENLYVLEPTSDGRFIPRIQPCGRGFWTRWAFAVAPKGIYFLAKDGVYLVSGGGVAVPISTPDLRPLFPHDGGPGVAVNGIAPPDMTDTNALRITYIAGFVYFDYTTVSDGAHTLIFDEAANRWYYDTYPDQVTVRNWEQGEGVSAHVMADVNGDVFQAAGTSDNGTAIDCQVGPPLENGGQPRQQKQFGDYILDVDPDGIAGGLSLTFGWNNFSSTLAPVVVGAGASGRDQYTQDVATGVGVLALNAGLRIAWSSSVATPVLYLWEPAFLPKVENTFKRVTDWDDAGFNGVKYVRGIWIRANTFGAIRSVDVQYDGGAIGQSLLVQDTGEILQPYAIVPPFLATLLRLSPTDANDWQIYDVQYDYDKYPPRIEEYTSWDDAGVAGNKFVQGMILNADTHNLPVVIEVQKDGETFAVNVTATHNGQTEIAYSFPVPFESHEMRLVPHGRVAIFGARWVFEPQPERARYWITQPTSHDFPGFVGVEEMLVGYSAAAPVLLSVAYDGAVPQSYTLPATGGVYARYRQQLGPYKGKAIQYSWSSTVPFALFKRDVAVKVWGWGLPEGARFASPFGGQSRADGAAI